MVLYSKNIVLEDGVREGFLELADGRIQAIHETWEGPFADYADQVIFPGFIDIHIHGWATGSFWFEKTAEATLEMCRTLPYAGVTSFLATSGADTIPEIKQCIDAADTAWEKSEGEGAPEPGACGAELLGVHLEGPLINPKYKGMQREECCIEPSLSVMEELYGSFRHKQLCRHMTIAVERNGAREVLGFCREHGMQTAIGHSAATFAEITAIKDAGIGGVTHTFSGMRGFHHRELGVAGSALYYDDLMCEFAKQTGLTVSHEAFDIAYRIKGSDRIILTTDCSGLAQTQTEFDHYIRQMKFVKDGDPIKGKRFILELPLHADVALIHAWKADKIGNVVYHRTARNFNPIMATAADFVIVEAEEIVEVGELDPDVIVTPSCLVDMIIQANPEDRN